MLGSNYEIYVSQVACVSSYTTLERRENDAILTNESYRPDLPQVVSSY